MSNVTSEALLAAIDAKLDTIVTRVAEYSSTKLLRGVDDAGQKLLKEHATSEKLRNIRNSGVPTESDDKYVHGRKILYRKILTEIFMPDGKVVQPANENKSLFFVGSFNSGKTTLFKQFKAGDAGIPEAAQRIFDAHRKGGIISSMADIRQTLFEDSQTFADIPNCPIELKSSVVRGEVAALNQFAVMIAKELGYNIIFDGPGIDTLENMRAFPPQDPSITPAIKKHEVSLVAVTAGLGVLKRNSSAIAESEGRAVPEKQTKESYTDFFRRLKDGTTPWSQTPEKVHVFDNQGEKFVYRGTAKDVTESERALGNKRGSWVDSLAKEKDSNKSMNPTPSN